MPSYLSDKFCNIYNVDVILYVKRDMRSSINNISSRRFDSRDTFEYVKDRIYVIYHQLILITNQTKNLIKSFVTCMVLTKHMFD